MAVKETTTTYTWPDGGVIKRIDVRTQKNGFAVAYLYADDREEERAARANIRAAIRLKGWGTLSDSRDNKFVLRVAGLRSSDELLSVLQKEGFITSDPQVHMGTVEQEQSKGLVANVKSRTLRWSGILATLGNALAITKGFLSGDSIGQIGMGASFAVADLPLAVVDEHDNSRQLNLLLKKLTQEYERNGIEIPKNASIYVETSNKGKTGGERFQDFLHQYANQIKCGFEVVASGFAIKAGLKSAAEAKAAAEALGETGKKFIPWKSVAGAIFGPGFLASLLIPEKKIDEDKYAKAGKFGRLWMRIQSNPLSVGGLLGYSNTIFTYASARTEQKAQNAIRAAGGKGNHLYAFDYTIPSIMIGANGLYAISKKTVGGDIKSDAMVQDAYRIASQIINKQPGELREKAMEITAQFFGQRMEIKEHYPEARARLVKELDSQRQNPWFELQSLAPYTPVPKHPHRNTAETDNALSQQAASTIAQPTNHVDTQGMEHSAPARTVELSA